MALSSNPSYLPYSTITHQENFPMTVTHGPPAITIDLGNEMSNFDHVGDDQSLPPSHVPNDQTSPLLIVTNPSAEERDALPACGSDHGDSTEPCLLTQLIQALETKESDGSEKSRSIPLLTHNATGNADIRAAPAIADPTRRESRAHPPPGRLCPIVSGFSSPLSSSSSDTLGNGSCVCLDKDGIAEDIVGSPPSDSGISSTDSSLVHSKSNTEDVTPDSLFKYRYFSDFDSLVEVSQSKKSLSLPVGPGVLINPSGVRKRKQSVTSFSKSLESSASTSSSSTIVIKTEDNPVVAFPLLSENGGTVLVLPPGVEFVHSENSSELKIEPG